jgi:uncharacterized protein (DUF1697 family)
MDRYVAFLRGMNLGGRRIKNDELRARFEDLGFGDVATFRASGNVIFEVGEKEDPGDVTVRVEGGLAESLGYEVPVFLRSGEEVAAIAEHEPFEPELVESSAGKLQVIMFLGKPPAKARKQVLALASDEDRLAMHERELYWLPSGGMLESALDLKAIGAACGLTTQRTKGTMDQIAAKHFAP